jgi:hypothetical protein
MKNPLSILCHPFLIMCGVVAMLCFGLAHYIKSNGSKSPALSSAVTLFTTEGFAEYMGIHIHGTPYGEEHLHMVKCDGSIEGIPVNEKNPHKNITRGTIVLMKGGIIIPLSPEQDVVSNNQSRLLEKQ